LHKLRAAGFVNVRTNVSRDVSDAVEIREDEQARVESWRLHVLIEAGYPLSLAERIAASEADLHRAVALVERGCTPETAAEILV